MSKELQIAASLARGEAYNRMAKELKVSPKTIARVRRLMDSGKIKVNQGGEAVYTMETGGGGSDGKVIELAFRLMRTLGCADPEVALNQACDFMAKTNPYILYYGVKTPAELITHLEDKNRQLQQKVDEFERQDEFDLARRLRISVETLARYKQAKKELDFPGGIGEYVDMFVFDGFERRGYKIGRHKQYEYELVREV